MIAHDCATGNDSAETPPRFKVDLLPHLDNGNGVVSEYQGFHQLHLNPSQNHPKKPEKSLQKSPPTKTTPSQSHIFQPPSSPSPSQPRHPHPHHPHPHPRGPTCASGGIIPPSSEPFTVAVTVPRMTHRAVPRGALFFRSWEDLTYKGSRE